MWGALVSTGGKVCRDPWVLVSRFVGFLFNLVQKCFPLFVAVLLQFSKEFQINKIQKFYSH
jgi:hypothetical protein